MGEFEPEGAWRPSLSGVSFDDLHSSPSQNRQISEAQRRTTDTIFGNISTMSSSVGAQDMSLEKLRIDAMRGKWSEVFETCKQNRDLYATKITGTGDTVLHMAVSNGQEKLVENMLNNLLVLEENIVLGVKNDRQNTPLHLAALGGNVEICKKIGGRDPSLIARRNIIGETPLFLAALYGRKEAFLWLHYLYKEGRGVSSTSLAHCIRRDDNDTILHFAIAEEHFDVAIEIVHLYKDHLKEMMRRNKEGLSPLHLLAAKPSAFKTTSFLERSFLVNLIYGRMKVEKKNQATTHEELQKKNQENSLVKHIKFIHGLLPFVLLFLLLVFFAPEFFLLLFLIPVLLLPFLQSESESMATPLSGGISIDTPLMTAAKSGAVEMVERVLELFPSRIKDVNAEGKNIVLLAVEYRQTEVFSFLCKQSQSLFGQVDKEGNNALHLAASLRGDIDWLNPGKTNWFEFVKKSMPRGLSERYNRKMETPEDIFRESQKEIMKSECQWADKTSQACSVVSTLVSSVAYAICTNVPGGFDDKGYAVNRNKLVFKIFAEISLLALLFSLISLILFLSIVASPSQSIHSWRSVPLKLYLGASFMFVSLLCLWISFCAGHFFMLDDESIKPSRQVYIVLSSVIIFPVIAQFLTFFRATRILLRTPIPRRNATHPIEYRRTKNKEKE